MKCAERLLWFFWIAIFNIMLIKVKLTLDQHRFEQRRPTYTQMFSNKYTVRPTYPWVSHPWMWKVNCMHLYKGLHIRDLSICRFWCLWGFLEPFLQRYQVVTGIWGSQKLHVDFWLPEDQHSKPLTVQGSTAYSSFICNIWCSHEITS